MRYLIAVAVLACAGLAYAQLSVPRAGEAFSLKRYEIVAATDGSMWRIDSATGFVHRCTVAPNGVVSCVQAR